MTELPAQWEAQVMLLLWPPVQVSPPLGEVTVMLQLGVMVKVPLLSPQQEGLDRSVMRIL